MIMKHNRIPLHDVYEYNVPEKNVQIIGTATPRP